MKDRWRAFGYALAGLVHLLRSQPHARFHLAATIVVVAVGGWLGLSALGWGLIVFAIGLVWVAEALNTAIEETVDLASPDRHPKAKAAKDVAAAAVLLAAATAVAVGLVVLGPPLIVRIR